jgi:antitoxin component YwqK of YwqJK toxin-antitoxin module
MKKQVIFILNWTVLLGGCESGMEESFSDWNGTGDDFERTFQMQESISDNSGNRLVVKSTDLPYSGLIRRVDAERTTEQTYEEGLLSGKSVRKSVDGAQVEASYVDGKLHGKMVIYDANGNVRSTIEYGNGKLIVPGTN